MSLFSLYCIVLVNPLKNPFPIDISKINVIDEDQPRVKIVDLTIGHLKKLINNKKSLVSDSDDLMLWKVESLTEDNNRWKVLEKIVKEINDETGTKQKIGKDLRAVGLKSSSLFEKIFPGYVVPKEHVHIIVQMPSLPLLSATTATSRIKEISRLGGLGGTNMKRKEHGLGYEGLDLTHIDNVCQRKKTIKRLLDDLFEKHIILIQSPPMAGKTSLAQLLEYSILQSDEVKEGSRCVFRISLMWMVKYVDEWTFAEGFETLMNMKWDEFIQLCRHSDIEIILIVDDVQLIYKPQNESEPRNGGSIFWNTFKQVNQYLSNFYIVAFASYGHYDAYTSHGDHSVMDISPPSILHKDNTWGFADVRFTEEEFNDYFNRFCEMHLRMLKKDDIPFLRNYVYKITAFHPGLVAFTMDEINKRFVKRSFELEFGDIFAYLKSYDFYSHLKGLRATPRVNDMTNEE